MNENTQRISSKYSKKAIILVIFAFLIVVLASFAVLLNTLNNRRIDDLSAGKLVSCGGLFNYCPKGYRCYSLGMDFGPGTKSYCHKETTLEDKYKNVTPVKEEGKFCGGIAGIACPEGYKCQLEGKYPDAGGKCVKEEEKPQLGDAATKEECFARGGMWDKWGRTRKEYCQYPAQDYNLDCTDGSQCVFGKCIAGEGDSIPGKCQKFEHV